MGTGQRWWHGIAVVAVVTCLGGVAPSAVAAAAPSTVERTAPSAAATGSPRTKTETVNPWAANGKLKTGLKVAGSVRGTCWTNSIAVSSSDAYRCMSKSFIYDPCFAPGTKTFTQLACMAAPWSRVVRFDLTAAIPKVARHPNGKPWVWADLLANGVRCITDTGTGTVVDKVVMNYYCVPGTGWADIPDQKAEPWTVQYAKSYKSKTVDPEKVTTAWY